MKENIIGLISIILLFILSNIGFDYFVIKPMRDIRLKHIQQWEQLKVTQEINNTKLDEKYPSFVKPLGRNYRYEIPD